MFRNIPHLAQQVFQPRTTAGSDFTTGLVGWWKLNEGSGTSTADATGNGNTGTLTNGPTWGTGPNSTGDVVFDGSNDYIAIANEANFDFDRTAAFSISAWIKWNATGSGSQYFFSKAATSGNEEGILFGVDYDNARLRSFLVNSSGSAIGCATANSSLSSGSWHHCVLTYDGSSDGTHIKIYIDNGTAVTGGAGTLTGSILNANPAWIGRSGSTFYKGEADDVRFYNIELTSGNVATLYTGGAK